MGNRGIDEKIKEKQEISTKEPSKYRVILHNDHYTTMEFVVEILISIFQKDKVEASKIMMDVHNKGCGIVGLYTYDIARTKVDMVRMKAKAAEFPLKCTYEKA